MTSSDGFRMRMKIKRDELIVNTKEKNSTSKSFLVIGIVLLATYLGVPVFNIDVSKLNILIYVSLGIALILLGLKGIKRTDKKS